MAQRKHPANLKVYARSRVSNGAVMSRAVDQRTLWARRFRDLLALHLGDLADTGSEAEKAIIRRACTLIVELERMEEGFALAGKAELNELEVYQRASNSMNRLLQSVGLKRRARDVSPAVPTLQQYLASRNQPHDEAAE